MKRRVQPVGSPSCRIVTYETSRSPLAEAYRTLRTQFLHDCHDKRVILLCGAVSGDGGSTIIANLSVALSQTGRKVVVVDANLRRPAMHEFFSLSRTSGLSTVLSEQTPVEQALQKTTFDRLTVLTSGPAVSNPSEVLSSCAMDQILASLNGLADIVLVDAPPVVEVGDAIALASKVDAVVLALGAGRVSRDNAQRARQLLERIGANLVGAILSDASSEDAAGRIYPDRSDDDHGKCNVV